jgi:F-type H+-transporting ATPase subunit b
LLACSAILLLCVFAAFAQDSSSPSARPLAQSQGSSASSSSESNAAAQATHEASANEKVAPQSDADALKQSPSVKWLAGHLGISVEAAYWVAVVLNFVLIALLLAWLIKKSVPGALRARGESIRKQMQDAQRASEDATRRLKEIEGRLNQLGTEISALQAEAVAQQQGEETRFKQAAAEEKERVLRSAQQEIASAATAARRDLRAYAAELAVNLAEKKIHVDSAADQNLVRDFVDQLGRNGS